jgi:hypothetical protein
MGVSITSVASKVSMVFPILFSLLFIKIESKEFTIFNYFGMFLAVVSIFLGSMREGHIKSNNLSKLAMFLWPFAVFVIGGFIDISVNYSNYRLLNAQNEAAFPIVLFGELHLLDFHYYIFKRRDSRKGV